MGPNSRNNTLVGIDIKEAWSEIHINQAAQELAQGKVAQARRLSLPPWPRPACVVHVRLVGGRAHRGRVARPRHGRGPVGPPQSGAAPRQALARLVFGRPARALGSLWQICCLGKALFTRCIFHNLTGSISTNRIHHRYSPSCSHASSVVFQA